MRRIPNAWPRFEREVKLLASVGHPGIAHVYGFRERGSRRRAEVHFLAMELGFDELLDRAAAPAETRERGVMRATTRAGQRSVCVGGRTPVVPSAACATASRRGNGLRRPP
jgi:hypothetical protein